MSQVLFGPMRPSFLLLVPCCVAVGAATLVLKHALEDSRLFRAVNVPAAGKT